MKMFNCISKLLSRKRKIVVLAPNKIAESMGLRYAWVFDLDHDELPVFHSASEKAKYEMATGEYSCYFDKFITEV